MGYGRRLLRALVGASLLAAMVVVAGPARAAYTECAAPPAALGTAKKILITGDSATNMSTGDYTWRYYLWQHFKQSGTPVDFVGSWNGTFDYIGGSNVNSHDYASCDFDWDHESRGGAKISDYNAATPQDSNPQTPTYPGSTPWIRGAVGAFTPDVVVEFAGFNDLFHYEEDHGNVAQGSVPNATMANTIVGEVQDYVLGVQAASASTDVLLATVPAAGSNRYSAYNTALKAAASSWSTASSTVRVVDLPSWSSHSWDGWHPDARGDAIIADAFAKALNALDGTFPLPGALPQPAIGPRTASTLTQATTPADGKVALEWTMSPNADRTVVMAKDLTAPGDWFVAQDLVTNRYVISYPNLGTARCQATILNASAPCTSLTVSGLIGSHQYAFKLLAGKGFAVATDLESNTLNATVTGTAPPPKPAKVALPGVTALEHAVKVTWAPVSDATGYQLRFRRSGAAWSAPVPVGATTRTVSGLTPGLVYEFSVRALRDGAPEGDYSEPKASGVRAYALAAPAKPRLAALAKHKIRATWTAVPKSTRYLVQVRLGAKLVKSVFVTKPTWTSGPLKKRKTYKVTVRPYDGAYGGGTSAAGSIKAK